MGDYRLTRYEMETIVNYNAEEDLASIYSCDPAIKRKLDALCESGPDLYKLVRVDQYGRYYSAPKELMTFKAPRKHSPERLAALQEQARRNREIMAKSAQ